MNSLHKWLRNFRYLTRFLENRKFRNAVAVERKKKYLIERPKQIRKPYEMIRFLKDLAKNRKLSRLPSFFVAKIQNEEARIRMALASVGGVLIILSLYILFFSGYFTIAASKVIIERMDMGSDINIAYKAIEDIYGRSIFFVSSEDIKKEIQEIQKNIYSVEVSRLFPKGVKIVISSYPNEFSTYRKDLDKYYYVTSNGILIRQQQGKVSDLPILDIVDPELGDSSFLDYKEGVGEERMSHILLVKKGIAELFPNLHVAKYSYFRLENELHIALESGLRLIVSLDGSEERQIRTIDYYNKQEWNPLEVGGISYIDVRVPGKIFVCKDEAVCIKNLIRIYGTIYLK